MKARVLLRDTCRPPGFKMRLMKWTFGRESNFPKRNAPNPNLLIGLGDKMGLNSLNSSTAKLKC